MTIHDSIDVLFRHALGRLREGEDRWAEKATLPAGGLVARQLLRNPHVTADPFADHRYEYRAIVGVDTKSFTGNPSARQPYLTSTRRLYSDAGTPLPGIRRSPFQPGEVGAGHLVLRSAIPWFGELPES